jgi:methylmalonyl-CoA mutase
MDAGTLFSQTRFPDADQARWVALAEKTLAGASAEAALASRTDDGIAILPHAPRDPNARLWPRTDPARRWIATQRIDDPDPARANRQAHEDLANGANGIALVFEGAPNAFGYGLPATPEALSAALDGLDLADTLIRVDAHPQGRASIDWLVAILAARRADPATLNIALGIDPAAVFAGTGRMRMSIEALQASMPQSLAHFFALGIPGVLLEADGRVFHNAGATEAQELGIVIATAVSHLRMFEEARQALVYAAPHIGFALSVDQDQFLSIAKIRALRKLWARTLEASSIEPTPPAIHVETSYRMLTAKDPETNILRSSIAAFAAGVGGADSISILPHTQANGLPAAFARRVARNMHTILAGESHVDHVADPIAGAGSVEALTEALCERAWGEFQRIEAEGGVMHSLASGKLQQRVRAARDQRIEEYRSGRRTIIGTTAFPAAVERPVETLDAATRAPQDDGPVVSCEPLEAVRIDTLLGTTR